MRRFNTLGVVALCSLLASTMSVALGEKVQEPGKDYLVFEAEDIDNNDLNDEFTGFVPIDPSDPLEIDLHSSNPGTIFVPPPSSNPSKGVALLDLVGGGDFSSIITYSLNFSSPGTYYLYARYTMFDVRQFIDNNYGNEDSIYLPVESIDEDPTNEALRASRDGHAGFTKNIPFNGGPTYLPDSGCRIEEEPFVIPDDECDAAGLRGDEQWEGQYHWQPMNFGNDLGQAAYDIGANQTGVALDFSIASRENGISLDAFIFSQDPALTVEDLDEILFGSAGVPFDFDGDGVLGLGDINLLSVEVNKGNGNSTYDVNGDGSVNEGDINAFVTDADKLNTYIGDANLDNEFTSADFVVVFLAGQYEDGDNNNSTWDRGDWNGDLDFTSSDFVAAFLDGGYELGPKMGVAATVPEPSSMLLALASLLALVGTARRYRR